MPTNKDDFALVIGINDYPRFRSLKGAIGDAQSVREWLIDKDTGGGLPDDNCKIVVSSPDPIHPIQDEIDDVLDEIITVISDRVVRRFYLYFSGHGLGQNYSDTAACLAKWSERWRYQALDIPAYCNLVAESGRFQEIVILLDCCRTRLLNAGGHEPSLAWVKPAANAGASRTFTGFATEYQNPSYEAAMGEDRNLMRGYFTQTLLSALRGGAAVAGGGVPASELKKFLELHTPRLAKEKNQKQRPEVLNGLDSDPDPKFGSSPPEAKVRIKFSPSRTGQIVLQDQALNVIKQGDATTGPWDVTIPAGSNVIREVATGMTQIITAGPAKGVNDVLF